MSQIFTYGVPVIIFYFGGKANFGTFYKYISCLYIYIYIYIYIYVYIFPMFLMFIVIFTLFCLYVLFIKKHFFAWASMFLTKR